jgi:hypothetical protein
MQKSKKKSNHVATDKRGKRHEGDDRRATTLKKMWAQRDERRRGKKSGRNDRERRLCNKAHAINNRWTSSDNESRDNDKKRSQAKKKKARTTTNTTILPWQWLRPPKRQKRPVASFLESRARSLSPTTILMPFSPRRRVSWATVAMTLWPSDGPHQQK